MSNRRYQTLHCLIAMIEQHEIEVCLGCGAVTSERDCGCPAGTGWILSRRECPGCGSTKAQCDAWKRNSAVCCPDCKHPTGSKVLVLEQTERTGGSRTRPLGPEDDRVSR